MQKQILIATIILNCANSAFAAPSPSPQLRPANLVNAASVDQYSAFKIPRPHLRPDGFLKDVLGITPIPLMKAPAPNLRPKGLKVAMGSRKGLKSKKYSKSGSVCGDSGIRGTSIARISGPISGCGISAPVRVTEIDGVKFSSGATMDCKTATSVQKWLKKKAQPAFSRHGGISKMTVVASYACRNRNSSKKGKLSEHAKGKAIDIAGFTLVNGQTVSVLKGWNDRTYSKAFQKSHAGACGIFGTVLGPKANALHRDHFHFDTASYRSGSYCR